MNFTTVLCAAAMATTATFGTAHAADDIESPAFEAVTVDQGVELRRYAPMIAAEVRVAASDLDAAGSMGFMPLANYIFGSNRPGEKIEMTAPVTRAPVTEPGGLRGGDGEKIAMTAPVTTAPIKDGLYTVQFMMPSKWTMETLPAPVDDRVSLQQVPERYVVVAGFTGPKEMASIDAAERRIDAFVASNGYQPTGSFTLAGYSAPNVPDPQKKWEVHLEVAAPE
ncbi:MAG: heme-binding protein [Pseudomonadota bacterium]